MTGIADLDPLAENLEGYLYPDTYSFARGTPESEIVATLVRTFRRRWEDDVVPALEGTAIRRTVRELVTLASIVEKEAQLDDERGAHRRGLRQSATHRHGALRRPPP